MSQRAIRRAQQRRQAKDRRRESLRRRRAGLAVTAALGATALLAPAAHAANDPIIVNSTADPGNGTCDAEECTLREAIDEANSTAGDDVIRFDPSLSGDTITLNGGDIPINASGGGLTIEGLPSATPTISGDDESRIFNISGGHAVSISDLTFADGYSNGGGAIYTHNGTDVTIANSVFHDNVAAGEGSGYDGGAILAEGALTVTGSQFTHNHADDNGSGGAIFAAFGATVRNSTLSGNTASQEGGGIAAQKYNGGINNNESTFSAARSFVETHTKAEVRARAAQVNPLDFRRSTLDIADSTISGNTAATGGGIYAPTLLKMSSSTVSGNTAHAVGGGIESVGKYAQTKIASSTISGNSAAVGGGINVMQTFGLYASRNTGTAVKHAVQSSISDTTISGNNHADYEGGGLRVSYLAAGDHLTLSGTTISGNSAGGEGSPGFGGGIVFSQQYSGGQFVDGGAPIAGEFRTVNTTISGNTAGTGAGVSAGGEYQSERVLRASVPGNGPLMTDEGSIDFENSTIASNKANSNGGGVYLGDYNNPYDNSDANLSPTIALTSTILGDNTAGGAGNDADRADGASGGGLDSTDSLVENPGDAGFAQQSSTITGVDPQLAPLTDNGGPTQTQMPAGTSPAIDKGDAPARLTADQRGHARTVDGSGVSNAPGGDGTDIGAVELDSPAVAAGPGQEEVAGDQTPPKINLKVPKELSIQQLIDGFNVTVSCNEPCSMTFRLYGSAPTGTLHSAGYNFRLLNKKISRKSGRRKVRLRPCVAGSPSRGRTHVCRRRITKALLAKPQKKFKVKLIVAAKDKAGNVSHRKRFIKVHR